MLRLPRSPVNEQPMANDTFEYDFLFRPQIAGRSRQGDGDGNGRSGATVLAQIRRSFDRSRRAAAGSQKSRYDAGQTPANSRRCVVKSHYVSVARGGRLAAARHLNYIERDGVERDGSPGVMYDARGIVDQAASTEPLRGEKRQFRFIISPEDAGQIDLRAFTRQLVEKMEMDLGRRLIWVDANGKELRIPPRYIKQDMRTRAQQLVTRELGLRTSADIAGQRQREIQQERFTSLDRVIEGLADADARVGAKGVAALGGQLRAAVLARLAALARFGMATPGRHGTWQLAPAWREDLAQLGLRDDIIKRLHRVVPGDPARYRILEPSRLSAPLEGVIRGRGLHDELTGELFAAVATTSGETHYVRLDPQAAEFVGDGDIVRISQTTEPWIKPTDQVLARIAERTGCRRERQAIPATSCASSTWERTSGFSRHTLVPPGSIGRSPRRPGARRSADPVAIKSWGSFHDSGPRQVLARSSHACQSRAPLISSRRSKDGDVAPQRIPAALDGVAVGLVRHRDFPVPGCSSVRAGAQGPLLRRKVHGAARTVWRHDLRRAREACSALTRCRIAARV